LLDRATQRKADVVSIGIGFGGPVDPVRGIVRRSHHVDGWEGIALRREFESAFGIATHVDNDANAGALGELAYGAARNRRHVLYVNIGTGIGGALIIDGKLHHGAGGNSGEIGHTVIDRPESTALPTGAQAVSVTCEAVFDAARDGDVAAGELVNETAELLGIGIANVLNLVNPELVVIGGGVSEAGDVLLVPLREAVRAHAMPGAAEAEVVAAALGYDAGVLGAVALAAQHADAPRVEP
jgi:predicted NBD/HSP70 family sugar kinase